MVDCQGGGSLADPLMHSHASDACESSQLMQRKVEDGQRREHGMSMLTGLCFDGPLGREAGGREGGTEGLTRSLFPIVNRERGRVGGIEDHGSRQNCWLLPLGPSPHSVPSSSLRPLSSPMMLLLPSSRPCRRPRDASILSSLRQEMQTAARSIAGL